jgi:nucleotide-binding universal stress UspA family protein
MPLMQKILVPTDLSPCSSRALAEAQEFASVFGASIDLLYVWSMPALVAPESVITGVGINEQPLLEWIRHSASEQLAKFETEARNSGIAVRSSLCESGDPATTIVARAADGKYDLLVLGTHGRTGLSHVIMGSVTEKVVRRSPCPVLTVRTAD